MQENELIPVEVAYASPAEQVLLQLHVACGTTLAQAVALSGVLDRFPQIDLQRQRVGIWSRLVLPDEILKPGDRVEIYRPLLADPKDVRRQRAAHKARQCA